AADVRGLFAMAAQGRHFPGYEPREGQRTMAEAIADVVTHGGRLAVEAGTGTGKSLAYLLPSLLNALWNDDRVVISTQTRNLQEQLASHDAPAAAAIVEAYAGADAGSLRVEVLKGRSNYLCLERWAEARADPRPRTEA